MQNVENMENVLSYIHSELNRIETMAGTLATIEQDHYRKLTNFDHRKLVDIAVEEQNAARQLGTVKQMCLSMAQKIEELQHSLGQSEAKERVHRAEVH
jgi:myo-inositol catabolism protein IolC